MHRNLTPATITEAKRQGAAELAEKLRGWIEMHQRSIALDISLQNHMYYRGWISSLEELSLRLDELAPPVTCDNPPDVEPLTVGDYVTCD